MSSTAHGLQRHVIRGLFGLSPRLLRRIAGPPRLSDEGVELELKTQTLLAVQARSGMATYHLRPESMRKVMDWIGQVLGPPPAPQQRVEDRIFDLPGRQIVVRFYHPHGADGRTTLFFHGGGFAIGSLESHDSICRYLAHRAGCVVAAVGYRLAPEHPFPAAVTDCVEVFRFVVEHAAELDVDPGRIAVCGDSAGATLATVICQQTRGADRAPCFQLLVYPCTDFTNSFPSHQTFAHGLVLNQPLLRWFTSAYVDAAQDRRDPRLSPLFAADVSGMPPALLITAGFDMLRDEGRAYARRMQEAGVRVELSELPNQTHGFLNMAGVIEEAKEVLDRMGDALRQALLPG